MGQRFPLQLLHTLNGDDFRGLFRENVATEIGHGISSCKQSNIHFSSRAIGHNHFFASTLSLPLLNIAAYRCSSAEFY